MLKGSQLKEGDYYFYLMLMDDDMYPKQYIVMLCNFISKAHRSSHENMMFATYDEAHAKAKELNNQLWEMRMRELDEELLNIERRIKHVS